MAWPPFLSFPRFASSPPQAAPRRFYDRPDALSFLTTFLVAMGVYLFTLPPSVTLEMAGMDVTAAYYAAVPHPPGYAPWTLYAWLFTVLVPWGNVAWRVALSSAVAGAAASGLVALVVSNSGSRLLENVARLLRPQPREEKLLRIACGSVAGCTLAFSNSFWKQAITPEPYIFGLLLFCLTIVLLQRWFTRTGRSLTLYAAIVVYGLTLSNSQYLFIAAPGLLLIVALANPGIARDFALTSSILLVLGLVGTSWGWLPAALVDLTQLRNLWGVYLLAALFGGIVYVVLAIRTRELFAHPAAAVGLVLCLTAGLSFYFYSALASLSNPPANWGYPRTLEGFIHLISRGQYEGIRPVGGLGAFLRQVAFWSLEFTKGYGLVAVLAAAIPFLFLDRLDAPARRWLLGLVPLFLCLSLFLLAMLNPPPDRSAAALSVPFYSAAHAVLALWTGYGLLLAGSSITTLTFRR